MRHEQSSPQAINSKPGCLDCHCDLEKHMTCLNYVSVYGLRKIHVKKCLVLRHFLGRLYFVGAYYFVTVATLLGALLLGRVLLIETLRGIYPPPPPLSPHPPE